MHGGVEDPAIAFISKFVYDFEHGQMYADDNVCTIMVMDENYLDATIRVEKPYTVTDITPVPAKYLSEAPREVFAITEKVVGTYLGKTLYEQTYTLDNSSALDESILLNIPDGLIEYGYIADAFIMLFANGYKDLIVKSFTPFMDKNGKYFNCSLGSDAISVSRSLPSDYSSYDDLRTVVHIRYTKKELNPEEYQIITPKNIQETIGSYSYGNLDGTLGLTADTQYQVRFTGAGQNITDTITSESYGQGIVALEGHSSISYTNIYDNAYYDYEDLQDDAPTLKYAEGKYCFKTSDEFQAIHAGFSISQNS